MKTWGSGEQRTDVFYFIPYSSRSWQVHSLSCWLKLSVKATQNIQGQKCPVLAAEVALLRTLWQMSCWRDLSATQQQPKSCWNVSSDRRDLSQKKKKKVPFPSQRKSSSTPQFCVSLPLSDEIRRSSCESKWGNSWGEGAEISEPGSPQRCQCQDRRLL